MKNASSQECGGGVGVGVWTAPFTLPIDPPWFMRYILLTKHEGHTGSIMYELSEASLTKHQKKR